MRLDVTNDRKLIAVKAFHTFVWFLIEASMVYVLVAGLRGRTDRRVAIASAIVVGETAVFAANGFRCPLTAIVGVARRRRRLGHRHLPSPLVRPKPPRDPRPPDRPRHRRPHPSAWRGAQPPR